MKIPATPEELVAHYQGLIAHIEWRLEQYNKRNHEETSPKAAGKLRKMLPDYSRKLEAAKRAAHTQRCPSAVPTQPILQKGGNE